MKKKDILASIKEDSYSKFNDYINNGGDCNLKIYGKSLIAHALNNRSDNCIYLLLLYGVETKELKDIKDLEKILNEMDPIFIEMVKEIDDANKQENHLRAQRIIQEASRMLLGYRPYSFRDILSHSMRSHAYATSLMVGIHLFEYRSWGFLMEDIKHIFQCEDITKKDFSLKSKKKFSLVVSAITLSEFDEEIPGLSHRITGFIKFLEVPTHQLEYQLAEMNKRETLIIGVHFSDEPSLVLSEDGEIDVHYKFNDYLKVSADQSQLQFS